MLLIFDFDGTLFDTAYGIFKSVNLTLNDVKHPELEFEDVISCIGGGLHQLVNRLNKNHISEPIELDFLISRFRHHYNENFREHSKPMEGAYEFLSGWQGELAIASNKEKFFIDELVKQSSLNEFNWRAIYGGTCVEKKKPSPIMLEKILEETGFSAKEAVMIGDGMPDVGAAKALNIPCIAVDFGYEASEELLANGATTVIKSFEELPEAISLLNL